jgi:uncharacterized protein
LGDGVTTKARNHDELTLGLQLSDSPISQFRDFPVRAGSTALTVYEPAGRPIAALVLAHGAGAGRQSRFMVQVAHAMMQRGLVVITFDFPYVVAGRRVPDKAPVLEGSWRTTLTEVRGRSEISDLPLFIGGKSMGGRMASHVAAQGEAGIDGLVFLGYPLHPPGRPQQRRDAHLFSIREPMLFVQGERDQFGTSEEIRTLLSRLNAQRSLHEIAGADHSFAVARSSGRSAESVCEEIAGVVEAWVLKRQTQNAERKT